MTDMAANMQADAVLDAVCHNGQRIQQAWEDNAEDERGDTNGEHHLSYPCRCRDPDRGVDRQQPQSGCDRHCWEELIPRVDTILLAASPFWKSR